MASHNSIALPEISPRNCLKYDLGECWCSWSKSCQSSRVNFYSHSPYKNNINQGKKEKKKMLTFLELAISWVDQFKVFSEYISLMLFEALKRNYYTSSNIFQCCVLYKKRNQIDTPLNSLFLSRSAGSFAYSDCWSTIDPNLNPPSEQHYFFLNINRFFFFTWYKYWRDKCLVWIATMLSETCQFLWGEKPSWIFSTLRLLQTVLLGRKMEKYKR